MAMLRAGAYSQKFQNLEKERVRQAKEQEKVNRGKAQLYSKQTAQRQKALEEKKKAMAVAEEDRRRRALEERREAQNEATKRFRSALGRIRTTSKIQGLASAKKNGLDFYDMYLPDKPKPKKATAHPQKTGEDPRERVALGKDVEIRLKPKNGFHPPRQLNGFHKRTPSLDDMLEQVTGERSAEYVISQDQPVNHGRVIIHQKAPDLLFQQRHVHPMGRRSASDPALNQPPSNYSSHSHRPIVKNNSDGSLPSHTASNLHRNLSDESIVFQAIHNQNPSKMEDDLRVTSPGSPPSSSDESLNDSLHDSLNNSEAMFAIGGEEIPKTEQIRADDASREAQVVQIPSPASGHQPIYVCDNDDMSSVDSLEDQRAARVGSGTSSSSSSSQSHSHISKASRESKPKVVGILKKSNSNPMMSRNSSTSTLKETEGTKAKKVRFADQLERSAEIPIQKPLPPNTGNEFIDSARIELWKRVLPNGVTTRYLPNSAFTPKMRVSLSSKASPSQQQSSKQQPPSLNGLTVHIPMTSVDSSPSSPQRQQESSHKEDLRTEQPVTESHLQPTIRRTEQSMSVVHPPRHQVSTASVGLNGVIPTIQASSNDSAQEESTHREELTSTPKPISLEKTPTDDEINRLWDQIRNALDQDNQKVFIPPQVFNFRINPGSQSKNHEASTVGSATKQASTVSVREDQRGHHPQNVKRNSSAERFYSRPGDTSQKTSTQRQTNLSRPMRCQSNFSPQSGQLLDRRGHNHTATYPVANRHEHNGTQANVQMTHCEPEPAVRNNMGRKAPMNLSLEEKRLMLSIENLNQKIKDHMARQPSVTKFQSPVLPETPDFTPEFYPHPPPPTPPQKHKVTPSHPHPYTHVNSHTYDLPKARGRRNPKTAALATAINPQAGEYSRTHARVNGHRPLLYN